MYCLAGFEEGSFQGFLQLLLVVVLVEFTAWWAQAYLQAEVHIGCTLWVKSSGEGNWLWKTLLPLCFAHLEVVDQVDSSDLLSLEPVFPIRVPQSSHIIEFC